MNKQIWFFVIFLSIFSLISLPASSSNIATNTARMQAMDKITGRVSEIDVPVGGLANFGSFSVLVRKCVTASPEDTPENTAFVDVVDNYRSSNPVNIFKGWMFSSTPALNAVEHPIYDIWLLKCYNRPQDREQLLSEDQLALRDTIPMVRHETPSPKPVINFNTSAEDNTPKDISDDTFFQGEKEIQSETKNDSIVSGDTTITIDLSAPSNTSSENLIEEDFISEGEEPELLDDQISEQEHDSNTILSLDNQ